jgi:hypothetical protein
MSERLNMADAKDYWFGGNLTVYAGIGPNSTVVALPAQEVDRGLIYLDKLIACNSYEAAEALYHAFKNDPAAPKLIPRIIDPLNDYEYIEILFTDYLNKMGIAEEKHLNYVDQEMGLRDFMDDFYKGDWLPHEYDDNYRELAEHIVRTKVPFVWSEALPYLDDNGLFGGCRNAERWTDAWMPVEITTAIGVPDTGYGIDYFEAEYIYPSLDKLVAEMEKHRFKVLIGKENFRRLYSGGLFEISERDLNHEQ